MPPTATYRLQLHTGGLSLAAVRDLVEYLDRLGVSHVYTAPLLRARTGSTHGYDVIDPTCLDPALGSEADLAALADALHARGMGLVVDVVPNHMAAADENRFWDDVLAHGPSSRWAAWFDVDWDVALLLPVLGDVRAAAIARGEIALVRAGST
ncbi:MAG TPA: alpha-amylase family glycosyl hydrolase, partial [Candidatus Binatia bacterium]|nr:alpha-amylase family glycosyl hydrolase [Candidatus Binatia bacterium]